MPVVRRSAGSAPSPGRITAWSYSRLRDYKTCPLKCKFKNVDRLKEPESEPPVEGSRVHKLAEVYLTGTVGKLEANLQPFKADFEKLAKSGKLPEEFEKFRTDFEALKKQQRFVACEENIALRRDWTLGDWFRDAWLRVKMDARLTRNGVSKVVDFKNGKVRTEDEEQLELYAVAVFAIEDTVNTAETELWYLNANEIVERTFTREADYAKLRKKWERESAPMLADTIFAPKPGKLCDWCHFGQKGKEAGGPGLCKY